MWGSCTGRPKDKASFLIPLFPLLITSKSIRNIYSAQLTLLSLYHHQLSPAANTSLLEESSSIVTGLLESICFRGSPQQWSQSNLWKLSVDPVTPLPKAFWWLWIALRKEPISPLSSPYLLQDPAPAFAILVSSTCSLSPSLIGLLAYLQAFWAHTCLRFFSLALPSAWNILPQYLFLTGFFIFRLMLKGHFFKGPSSTSCQRRAPTSPVMLYHSTLFHWLHSIIGNYFLCILACCLFPPLECKPQENRGLFCIVQLCVSCPHNRHPINIGWMNERMLT